MVTQRVCYRISEGKPDRPSSNCCSGMPIHPHAEAIPSNIALLCDTTTNLSPTYLNCPAVSGCFSIDFVITCGLAHLGHMHQ